MFFKIESWKFQHLFEKEFRETSQNFNSFSLFRIFYFHILCPLSDWVEILWGFKKFFFKQMLKFSAFYLEKRKFYSQKIYNLGCSLYIGQESSNRWRFAVPIFQEGFALALEKQVLSITIAINLFWNRIYLFAISRDMCLNL